MKSKRFQWALVALCIVTAGCSGTGAKYGTAEAAPAGSLADFTLKDTGGQDVNLKQTLAAHKAVLVNFWATWCPPCNEEIPGLIDLQAKYGSRGFTVLGVDVGESAAKVSSFAKRKGINYPLVLDSNQSVAESYGVVGIPTSYLVGPDGKVIGEYHAYTPDLVAAVEKAVA